MSVRRCGCLGVSGCRGVGVLTSDSHSDIQLGGATSPHDSAQCLVVPRRAVPRGASPCCVVTVRRGALRRRTMPRGIIGYSSVLSGTIQYYPVLCGILRYCPVWFGFIRCHPVLWGMIWYYPVWWRKHPALSSILRHHPALCGISFIRCHPVFSGKFTFTGCGTRCGKYMHNNCSGRRGGAE